jgi:hypothetical protein
MTLGLAQPVKPQTQEMTRMKSIKFTLLAVLVSGGLALPAIAEDSSIYHSTNSRNEQVTIVTDRGESNLNLKELQDFAQVTNADPNVARALSRHPALVDNASFVGKHPALAQFLAEYPDAREEIKAHPGNFVEPTNASAWNAADNQQNRGGAQ